MLIRAPAAEFEPGKAERNKKGNCISMRLNEE